MHWQCFPGIFQDLDRVQVSWLDQLGEVNRAIVAVSPSGSLIAHDDPGVLLTMHDPVSLVEPNEKGKADRCV